MNLNKRVSSIIATLILGLMFLLMFFSILGETAIMDELAHIPAGYSYITLQDFRLNPEHPPLIKDLAAFPLIFLGLNFPTDATAWKDDINGQWDMGRIFLYESGNDPDRILFASRLPMIFLALVFGWLIFVWTRGLYGTSVGLLALFFFAFSPTFIAHSRYVTTDLAAAFGFFIGIVAFVRYLEIPNAKRLFLSGAALGAALLLKFSTALLIPLFIIIAGLWGFLSQLDSFRESSNTSQKIKKLFKKYGEIALGLLIIFSIAAFMIAFVYQLHVWNYPAERQIRDTEFILSSFGIRPLVDLTLSMASIEPLRGLGEYMLGLLMVIQRAAGGNDVYFLGQISASGWWYYFPVAYLLKEPMAFLLLIAVAIFVAIRAVVRTHEKSLAVIFEWMRDNYFLTVSFLFIAVYWFQSMRSPLNIGVRHVLPTFPFIYLLVSREIIRWLKFYSISDPKNISEWFYSFYERYIKSLPRYLLLTFLLLWMFLSVTLSFPNYLSYFNKMAEGSQNGYKYIVDSNYDWGQDLRRLARFTDTNNISSIAVDYFGGGSPKYYLGDKFVPWWSSKGRPDPSAGDPRWFAVSATILQGATALPVKGFIRKPEDSYGWLRGIEPTARAGHSIFIYKF